MLGGLRRYEHRELQRGGEIGIGRNRTVTESAEIEALCQRNRELLLRVDFMLGMDTSLATLSTSEILIVASLMIDENKRRIVELKDTLRSEQSRT
jgi:hypothetical protein